MRSAHKSPSLRLLIDLYPEVVPVPECFASIAVFLACCLVVAGAQLIYATVGFGAGMFSVALLALLLPDLQAAVAMLLALTFVTEVWVLVHAWRDAKLWLLAGLLPTAALGMWLGTQLLVTGNVTDLKRGLGLFVICAGVWFLWEERRRCAPRRLDPAGSKSESADTGDGATPAMRRAATWAALPIGLASGVLAGLFGTGGPPVIVYLRAHRLNKAAFRATILWFFMLMSLFRGTAYLRAGVLTWTEIKAALWLLPASLVGTMLGMIVHHRLSERHFATAVSVLLVVLGGILAATGGR